MGLILCIIVALIGYVIGLKAAWPLQLAVIIGYLLYIRYNRTFKEIAALIPLIGFYLLLAGLVVGNVVYLLNHPQSASFQAFKDGIGWLFTP